MSFRRPVGAPVDVKELQYVSALHQTCLPVCREDATVSSVDIVRFLRSRFALKVSHKDVIRVVRGLGGGVMEEDVLEKILEQMVDDDDEEEEEEEAGKKRRKIRPGFLMNRLKKAQSEKEIQQLQEEETAVEGEKPAEKDEEEQMDDIDNSGEDIAEEYLDLVQLLAIILMPTLARAGKEYRDGLLSDVKGALDDNTPNDDTREDLSSLNFIQKHKAHSKAKQERLLHKERESLRPKPDGIIGDVRYMLLKTLDDKSSSQSSEEFKSIEITEEGPILDADLVVTLLESWGEHERAKDIKLVDAMVEAAGGAGKTFDEEAFVNALTSDLSEWEIGVEDRLSTTYFDVWGYCTRLAKQEMDAEKAVRIEKDNEEDDVEHEVSTSKEVEEEYIPHQQLMGANIDFAVDCHNSVVVTCVLWLFFVCTALVYTLLIQSTDAAQTSCAPSFGCTLGGTIWRWLAVALILSVTGLVVIVPLSMSNTPVTSRPRVIAACFFIAALWTYLPYIIVLDYRNKSKEPYNDPETVVNDDRYDYTQVVTFAVGNALMLLYIVQFLFSLISSKRKELTSNSLFVPANTRGGQRTKKAATRKINRMLCNAHSLHPTARTLRSKSVLSSLRGSSAADEAMANYVLRGESQEDCGGLVWTWRKMLSGELFDTEGVWINSRIYVFQTAQAILGLATIGTAFWATGYIADLAEDATQELIDLDIEELPQWVYDIVPTRGQVYGAFYPANGVLILVMLTLWLIYLPSAVATTLQYRCGMIPSLTARLFNAYRGNPDTVYLNIGNAIYGLIGGAVIFWGLTALVVFLFVWEFTRDIMFLLVAWGIGLSVTIVLKMIMTTFCRKKYYAAYYRTRPFAANLSLLALECWYIGLGGGILLGRFTQFILAACFWVGRIDARFLDEDVNLIGYGFDYVPFNFVKDLLGHEAHRHPYIDRLGTMYMMKLKHNTFGSDAGACWRQLFVVALMPWMMKHRVFDDAKLADALEAYKKKRKVEREEEKKHQQGIVQNAVDFGEDLVVGLKTGGMGIKQPDEVTDLDDYAEHEA